MSDLQCPARFVVLVRDDTTAVPDRVAVVYDGSGEEPSGGATFAERLAVSLEAPHRPVSRAVAFEDVESRSPVALEILGDLADLHRGETVVLVVDGVPGSRLDVEVDADGLVVRGVGTGSAS